MARTLTVTIDASGAVTGGRLASTAITGVGTSASRLNAQTQRMDASMNRSVRTMGTLAVAARTLSTAFKGLIALAAVQEFLRLSDAATQVSAKIRLATDSQEAYNDAYEKVFDIAQKTRAPLEATATLYTRVTAAAKDLGASTEDVTAAVETINKSLIINGTSSEAASSALLQLSQALGGSKVQAEEYNSLIDGARPLLEAVAKGMYGAEASVNTLTRAVKAGDVSSKEFFQGILKGADDMDAKFEKISGTVGGALTKLFNAAVAVVGAFNDAIPVTTLLSWGITQLADGFELLAGWIIDAKNAITEWITEFREYLRIGDDVGSRLSILSAQIETTENTLEGLLTMTDRFGRSIDNTAAIDAQRTKLAALTTQYNNLLRTHGPLISEQRELEEVIQATTVELSESAKAIQEENVQLDIRTSVLKEAIEQGWSLAEAEAEIAYQTKLNAAAGLDAVADIYQQVEAWRKLTEEERKHLDTLRDREAAEKKAAAATEATQRRQEQASATLAAKYLAEQRALEETIAIRTRQVQGLLSETEAITELDKAERKRQGFSPDQAGTLAGLAETARDIQALNAAGKGFTEIGEDVYDLFKDIQRAASALEFDLQADREQQEKLITIWETGVATGRSYEDVLRDIAIAEREAAYEAQGVTNGAHDLAVAWVDGQERIEAAADSLKNMSAGAILAHEDINTMVDGIISGTQQLPEALADLGEAMGVRLVKGLLFGKEQNEGAILGNFEQLLGPIAGPIFDALGLDLGKGLVGSIVDQISSVPGLGLDPTLIKDGFEQIFYGGQVTAGINTAFNGLGTIGAGAFGTAFGTGVSNIFGPGGTSGIGNAAGGLAGTLFGTIGAEVLFGAAFGPVGIAISAAIGAVLGDALEGVLADLFKPGRIELEKKAIEEWFEEASGLLAHATFPASDAEQFQELENSLHVVGIAYANLVGGDSGLGTVKRVANLATAAMVRHNLTMEEAGELALKLADSLGIDAAGSVQELNNAILSLRGAAGDFDLNGYLEEVANNENDIILVGDALEGIIDLFTAFTPYVDQAVIANRLMAEEFEEIAERAGLAGEAIDTLTEDIANGSVEIEDAIDRLNRDYGLSLTLNEVQLDAGAVEAAIDRINTEIDALLSSAGTVWADAVAAGVRDSEEISAAFVELVESALLDALVIRFIDDQVATLLEGFDLTEPIDLSSEAFQALADKVGLAGENLFALIEAAGLLPDYAETAAGTFTSLGDSLHDTIAEGIISGMDEGFSKTENAAAIRASITDPLRDGIVDAIVEGFINGAAIESLIQPVLDVLNEFGPQVANNEFNREDFIGRMGAAFSEITPDLDAFISLVNDFSPALAQWLADVGLLTPVFDDLIASTNDFIAAGKEEATGIAAIIAERDAHIASLEANRAALEDQIDVEQQMADVRASAAAQIAVWTETEAERVSDLAAAFVDSLGVTQDELSTWQGQLDTLNADFIELEKETNDFTATLGDNKEAIAAANAELDDAREARDREAAAIKRTEFDRIIAGIEALDVQAEGLAEDFAQVDEEAGQLRLDLRVLGEGAMELSTEIQAAEADISAAAARAKQAIVDDFVDGAIQPFIDAGQDSGDALSRLQDDFYDTQDAIQELQDVTGDTALATQLLSDATASYYAQVQILTDELLGPISDRIEELTGVFRDIDTILADVGTAESLEELQSLRDEGIASINAALAQQIADARKLSQDQIAEQRKNTADAIQGLRDAAEDEKKIARDNAAAQIKIERDLSDTIIDGLQDQLDLARDYERIMDSATDAFESALDALIEGPLPTLSAMLADIATASDPDVLSKLQSDVIETAEERLARAIDAAQEVFDTAQDAELDRLQEREDQLKELIKLQDTQFADEKKALEDLANVAQDIADSARDTRESYLLSSSSTLGARDQLGLAQSLFDEALAAGLGGDADAASRAIDLFGELTEIAQGAFAGTAAGQTIIDNALEGLASLESLYGDQASDAELQLAAMEEGNETLDEIAVLLTELGLTGNESTATLQSLLDQTIADSAAEEARELDTTALTNEAIAELTALQNAFLSQMSGLLAGTGSSESIDMDITEERKRIDKLVEELNKDRDLLITGIENALKEDIKFYEGVRDLLIKDNEEALETFIDDVTADWVAALESLLFHIGEQFDVLTAVDAGINVELQNLINAIVDLADATNPEGLSAAISAFAAALNTGDATLIGPAISTLLDSLTDEQLPNVLPDLLAALNPTAIGPAITAIVTELDATTLIPLIPDLVAGLDSSQISSAMTALLNLVKEDGNPNSLHNAVEAIVGELTDPQIDAAITAIVASLEGTGTNVDALNALLDGTGDGDVVGALTSLFEGLDADGVASAVDALIGSIDDPATKATLGALIASIVDVFGAAGPTFTGLQQDIADELGVALEVFQGFNTTQLLQVLVNQTQLALNNMGDQLVKRWAVDAFGNIYQAADATIPFARQTAEVLSELTARVAVSNLHAVQAASDRAYIANLLYNFNGGWLQKIHAELVTLNQGTPAARGLHGMVTSAAMPIVAHRGERVDIWTPAETARGAGAGAITININGANQSPDQIANRVIAAIKKRRSHHEVI